LIGLSRIAGSDFIVDLSQVGFIDSSIVEMFVSFQRLLELQSRSFTLDAVTPFVRRVLDICGTASLINAPGEFDREVHDRPASNSALRPCNVGGW